jgi:pimeloyl-ACP methyl ester carboxylesterase
MPNRERAVPTSAGPSAHQQPGHRSPEARARVAAQGRRAGRLSLLLLLIVVTAAVATEAALAARDARRHPPPGEFVVLEDGRRLHLDVTTRGSGGPTVVFEAGAGLPSSFWGPTVDAVVATIDGPVTLVVYDRAGTAWSDPTRRAPMPEQVVADLRDALGARGLHGPHLLVGHSIGGHYVREFAAAHPAEVSGVLLIDPRHEDAALLLPELAEAQEQTTRMLRWGVRLQPFGITRLVHQPSDRLPAHLAEQLHALELQRSQLRGSLALGEALDQLDASVARHATDLGDAPVRVVSAGRFPADEPLAGSLADVLDQLHDAMTGLSSSATRHVMPDADHLTIVTDPAHASELAQHIAELLATDR